MRCASSYYTAFLGSCVLQIGNGIADMRTEAVILEAARESGLEIVEFRNAHYDGDLPW